MTVRRPETAHTLRTPDGVSIAWRLRRARAASAAPPIVLLHGLASNLTRFSEFVERTSLDARHDLLRIDLRGHGESVTRGPLSMPVWCDDLAAVLDAAGHAGAVLVGHSLGAQVALHFAARHAGRTRGLVLIDPVFRDALLPRRRRLARAGPLLAVAAATVRAVNAMGLHRRRLPALDLRALDEDARRALATPRSEAAFVRAYSAWWRDLRTTPTAVYLQDLVEMFRAVPAMPGVPPPMLALLSTAANFADASRMRRRLEAMGATVLDVECNHWPLTERPVQVREAIEAWCAGRFGDAG